MFKRYYRSIILLLTLILLYSISGFIFKTNNDYLNLLILPNFMLNKNIHSILWFIIYILISISIIIIKNKTNILKNYDYLYILLTNYLSLELFMYFFFYLMSPFLGFAISCVLLISTILLFVETKKISKISSYFLIPYFMYTLYNYILICYIYFANF